MIQNKGYKYIYLGFITEQRIVRIPLTDTPEVFKRLMQGWVYSTKEAWNNYQDGCRILFRPTEYPTGTGRQIFTHVVYPPSINKR